MDKVLKILIVEDDAVIAQLIEQDMKDAGHDVIEVVHKYSRALSSFSEHELDLVLLDINLGEGHEGIKLGDFIHKTGSTPFIYLTAHSDPKTLEMAKMTQPCGYVVKPYKLSDLLTAITIGLFNFSKRLQGKELKLEEVNRIATSPISKREFEILLDITMGLTNSQISEKHSISINTTKWHIQNIYSKMQVKNRTTLVRKVYEI